MTEQISGATDAVLSRLRELGFEMSLDTFAPFDQALPLVKGAGWDPLAAQLVLVAEEPAESFDEDGWRQLLFAVSGLRSFITADRPGDRAPALASPILFALAEPIRQRQLRLLAEEIAEGYVVFNRVDLNIVDLAEGQLVDLDTDLAPVLPATRNAVRAGVTVSTEDLNSFWSRLREEVVSAARDLESRYGASRSRVIGERVADRLVANRADSPNLPGPAPIRSLALTNFRSFAEANVEFEAVTILRGINGSGKSSLIEALELAWAGDTARRPADARPAEYGRHLRRGGEHDWLVRGYGGDGEAGGGQHVDAISDTPRADLGRSVLTQDSVGDLVASAPRDRMAEMLRIAGLDVPQLGPVTEALQKEGKERFDRLLRSLGIDPLSRANSRPFDHLQKQMEARRFVVQAPDLSEVRAAESAVSRLFGDTYELMYSDLSYDELLNALSKVDEVIGTAISLEPDAGEPAIEPLDSAAQKCRSLAKRFQERGTALREVLSGIQASTTQAADPPTGGDPPIPLDVAARWKAHADALSATADAFRLEAAGLSDQQWSAWLIDYADRLAEAAALSPRAKLEALLQAPAPRRRRTPSRQVGADVARRAGFTAPPPDASREEVGALEYLAAALERYGTQFAQLAAALTEHPVRRIHGAREELLDAGCELELAQELRRAGSPIENASEDLLHEMLQGRLLPILRELVSALVRFEWYFKPLEVKIDGRKALLTRLATDRTDLDARYLLNSAERGIVGVGWFLALHVAQPPEQRQVLVLDDPTGDFDEMNRAAFVATVRTFLRIARPEQCIMTTHDNGLAALFEEEFAPVGGWPSSLGIVSCARNEDDLSVVRSHEVEASPPDLARELGHLGLGPGQPPSGNPNQGALL